MGTTCNYKKGPAYYILVTNCDLVRSSLAKREYATRYLVIIHLASSHCLLALESKTTSVNAMCKFLQVQCPKLKKQQHIIKVPSLVHILKLVSIIVLVHYTIRSKLNTANFLKYLLPQYL